MGASRKRTALSVISFGAALLAGADEVSPAAPQEIDSRNPLHETGREKDHLTGDWAGWRTKLIDRGVHFQFGYIGEVFGNLSGGRRQDVEYEGLGEMALELDLQKLASWRGGMFRASSLWLHGRGPSLLAGDVLTASNIDGHDSIRLYELWLQQSLIGDAVSIRAGSLLADEEFAGTEGGGLLLNSAFGWPAFISGNVVNTGPAFYVTALGVRMRIEPNERWYFQSGIYDGDTFDGGDAQLNESGTHFRLNSDQGAFVLNEVGLHWGKANDRLPGTLKLGGWIHTADFRDNSPVAPVPVGGAGRHPTHDYNFGGYVAAEQMLWREPGEDVAQGLSAFFRLGGSPEDRSVFAFVIDTGLHYVGLISGRDDDKTALGFVHADFSDPRGDYSPFCNFEQVVELTHQVVVRPWWSLQPDVQWIHNPGGCGGPRDALLLGLRTTISF